MHSLSAWTENNRLALFSSSNWNGGGWYASSSIAWLIWLGDKVFRKKERYGNSVTSDVWRTWAVRSIQKGRIFKCLFNLLRSSIEAWESSLSLVSEICWVKHVVLCMRVYCYDGLFLQKSGYLLRQKRAFTRSDPWRRWSPVGPCFQNPLIFGMGCPVVQVLLCKCAHCWPESYLGAWWAPVVALCLPGSAWWKMLTFGLMQTAYVSLAVLPGLWWWIYTVQALWASPFLECWVWGPGPLLRWRLWNMA